ncbi:methyltransferase [Antrihabitans stalactiti]|uniref:Methyltransferase domain-containing protein n=1 Tax=Antrihabitans stalactiti TaxID=2584121 RepID=A0A848KIV7_9NOCA|nr:methyltransferase [Antrihabitans stalactiti]NMN96160.1 methyltransferase domain-containing protein [Antrihabitans stalactiti]
MTEAQPLTSDGLVRILFGAGAFQMLNAGCELGLFRLLRDRPGATAPQIMTGLGLQARPVQILLLGTTALGLTIREGDRYDNSDLVESLFQTGSWDIIDDLVEFQQKITGPASLDFVPSLRSNTNVGLRTVPGDEADLYRRIAGNPEMEKLFFRCMKSWSSLSNPILVANAQLTRVRRVLDVGGGDAVNSIALAEANIGVQFTVLDLPGAVSIARDTIAERGLGDRIDVVEGDMFAEPFPSGHDCVLFANQLVIWSPDQNRELLRKAHAALPDGGQVLIFNAMSDDSGDGPLYAALDNVYFATLPNSHSMIYHWAQYEEWLVDAGFRDVFRRPGTTWTPHGVIGAVK